MTKLEHLPFGNIRITSDDVLYSPMNLNKNKENCPDNITFIFNIKLAQSLSILNGRLLILNFSIGRFSIKWKLLLLNFKNY